MAKAKEAGRKKADGNVTIDLGESIEKRLRATGMAGSKKSLRGGGYRPGQYRPFFAASGKKWELGAKLGLPAQVSVKDTLTGVLLGTVGNRVLRGFVTGKVMNTSNPLVIDAVNFGVGIVPYLAKPNSMTVGIAIPGLVQLAGTLSDYALDKIGVLGTRSVINTMAGRRGALDAALAARQRLADIQTRIATQVRAPQYPRVQARPQFVA